MLTEAPRLRDCRSPVETQVLLPLVPGNLRPRRIPAGRRGLNRTAYWPRMKRQNLVEMPVLSTLRIANWRRMVHQILEGKLVSLVYLEYLLNLMCQHQSAHSRRALRKLKVKLFHLAHQIQKANQSLQALQSRIVLQLKSLRHRIRWRHRSSV